MRPLSDEETRDGRLNPLQLKNLAERNTLTSENAVEHIRGVLGVIATPAPERPPARVRVAPIQRISNRRRRRLAYKRIQSLYAKDKSRVAQSVLDGTWMVPGTFLQIDHLLIR